MTEQDREEVRRLIREEIEARTRGVGAAPLLTRNAVFATGAVEMGEQYLAPGGWSAERAEAFFRGEPAGE